MDCKTEAEDLPDNYRGCRDQGLGFADLGVWLEVYRV